MIKQIIRIETFETNSSSYHTLAITKIADKKIEELKDIVPGEDLVINTRIKYKTIGDTESYSFVARNNYERAQIILRIIAAMLEEQFDDIVPDSEWITEEDDKKTYDFNKRKILFKDNFYELPLIKAFVNAVKQFIGNDKNVTIEFTESMEPYIEPVWDEANGVDDLLRVEDLTDVDLLTNKIYEYIFSGEYELTEECESNE